MEENGNNIDQVILLVAEKVDAQISNFKFAIELELSNIENKIAGEMKNLGISETSLINKEIEFQKSLGVKILMGFHYCTFGISTIVFGIGYGLFYALPNYIINKAMDQRKFNQFIDETTEYVENFMKSYSISIEKNIKKFKELTFENAKRLLGLLESNSIQTDDFWKEAKRQYQEIYNDYKKIKNL